MVTSATESIYRQSAPLCTIPTDCLYKVIMPCISHPTDVFALSLTCRQLAPLAYKQEIWDLFFKVIYRLARMISNKEIWRELFITIYIRAWAS